MKIETPWYEKWRLYFFARTDMDSMTPGRIAAQAHHAGSLFNTYFLTNPTDLLSYAFNEWNAEAQGFGTVIVLNGRGLTDVDMAVRNWESYGRSYFKQNVVDPEYAVQDGLTTHLIPNVRTGINIFCQVQDYNNLRNKLQTELL